ncbi:MAG: glycoside hydrolase family 31 protein [Bacillaceae bacterium]
MLNDTSFAIHPGKEIRGSERDMYDAGKILSFAHDGNRFLARCENGEFAVTFYADEIVRLQMNPFGETEKKHSQAVVMEPEGLPFSVTETGQTVVLSSGKIRVEIGKDPLRVNIYDGENRPLFTEGKKGMGFKAGGEVVMFKEMGKDEFFYGFGEKTGYLNKRGEILTMWNSDVYAPHNPETDPLYQSIPFFIAFDRGFARGLFFDNPGKTVFDLQSDPDHLSITAESGSIDYYVFAGPTMKDVLAQYTALTGRMPLPPKWAIGYHQSRYSYESEEEVRRLVEIFKEKGIPLDVVHLDIHYMRGFRVFTFDRSRFPDPKKLVADLKKEGVHVVPIVDPGVKEDPEYPVFQEGIRKDLFCKYLDGTIFYGDVWPGNSAFPDFTDERVRKWWGEKHQFYIDLGIEGIWNDMNEPAVFNETKTMDVKVMHANDGDPKTHRELHNMYGFFMGKATYEGLKERLKGKRPFLLTRSGYAGIQRYSAVWTGDNRSFWEHLQMSLPMVMNLGLSGITFAGADVGGFAHHANGELLARWTQAGSFMPFFRNHSALGTLRQEPWAFGEKYEKIIKKYIELRYRWLPQWYTLFEEAHRKGTPVMRPLVMEYPDDENTYSLFDQFMVGDNVIVAPIMQPAQTVRSVYLPEGNWIHYFTGETFEGGKYHLVEAPLEQMPIFVKQGTMIAHGEVKRNTKEKDESLTLHYYYGPDTRYEFALYDDDGESFAYQDGEYFRKSIRISADPEAVYLEVKEEGNYRPDWKELKLAVHNGKEGLKIYLNGKALQQNSDGTYRLY